MAMEPFLDGFLAVHLLLESVVRGLVGKERRGRKVRWWEEGIDLPINR